MTTLVTAAATEPVTLQEAFRQLNLETDSGEDSVVKDIITDARTYVERFTGQSLAVQTWKRVFDEFPDTIELLRGPVTAVTELQYYDTDNASQTLNVGTQIITDFTSVPARITPLVDAGWPDTEARTGAVSVTYTAGYTAANIPGNLKRAILLMVGFFYDNRGDRQAVIPDAFYRLIETENHHLIL